MDISEINKKLRKSLDGKRYAHSIGVAETAAEMAERFGADTDKAYLAGLLHDCAKCISYDESLLLAKKYNCELDDVTLKCPGIVHAPVGAVVARYEYDTEDCEILDAICYHTAAREKMTLLDKIIYVADMAEPSRTFDGVEDLRRLTKEDIDLAFCEALRFSLLFNIKKGNIMHPNTLYAWNEMCKNKHR